MYEMKKNTIVCAVVIYRSALTDCNVYKTFISKNLDTIDCLMVFDNSPESLFESISLAKGIYKYHWRKDNPGVSANYNKAAEYAAANGYEWILLLDQDTSFPEDALSTYKDGINKYTDESVFIPMHKIKNGKYISPVNSFKRTARNITSGIYQLKKYDIINSGMLIRVAEFISSGGYKEDVKLDFSDFQFIERLRKKVNSVVVLSINCIQDFSYYEQDKSKLIDRFRIYCENVVHFETDSFCKYAKITYLVIKHTLSLSIRCKSLVFVKILSNTICKNKK